MRKWRKLIALSIALLMLTGFTAAVNAEGSDTVDRVLARLGTTQEGYYPWCINRITDCFKLMDKELTNIGFEHDITSSWENCIDDTLTRFEGVDEETALDKLQELIDEVTQ